MIIKVVSTNRKAHHNYAIIETFEAGIVLLGSEIKSVRESHVNLGAAYVRAEHGELWLVGAHIAQYEAASYMAHEPTRPRKLLMHRKEIRILLSNLAEKGLTIVPLSMYFKEHKVKLEIGLGRGKKLYDKRETIMRRENAREMERTLKRH
jgi:SsrA-binding protein